MSHEQDPVLKPEVRVPRPRRWYLKDKIFLSEIGGALAFFGLLLMMGVAAQKNQAELAKDQTAASFMSVLAFLIFVMSATGCGMAFDRLFNPDGPARTFARSCATLFIGTCIGLALVGVALYGVAHLILPLHLFFGWLTMTAGFTLVYVHRRKRGEPR